MKRALLTALLSSLLIPVFSQTISVTDRYKYYDGSKVGRLVQILSDESISDVKVNGQKISINKTTNKQTDVILPENIGVSSADTIKMDILNNGKIIKSENLIVPKMRHWTILMYPHAHVDIGYTHTHEIVEFIHKQNLEQAILLGEATKDYPEDARFVWNTEVSWAVERYLATESPEKCKRLIDGIKKGYISVDATYINTHTTASHEPELLELYSPSKRISKLTGVDINTMVIVDIPGISWGMPAIADITGVKNIISLPNAGDRVGRARELDYHPRFWLAPDGKTKLLYIQPGPYTAGMDKRNDFFFKNLGLEDKSKLPVVTRTNNPRDRFIDTYIKQQLPKVEADSSYVFDIFPMAWCMSDNVPIDADLPDAVKSWNEEYAYPHLKIASSKDIVEAYRKHEESIPTVSGDYTEYWTDGLGTSAKYTSHHREVKETLMQSEILSCITGNPIPESEVQDAWRNTIMGTEHTWAYIYPDKPISQRILDVKYGYFTTTDSLAKDLTIKALPSLKNESSSSNIIAVFNTESFVRSGIVSLPNSQFNHVKDASTGNDVPTQILSDGTLVFYAKDIPALSSKNFILAQADCITSLPFPSKTCQISNEFTTVKIDKFTGDIASLVTNGKEFANVKYPFTINTYRYLISRGNYFGASQAYDVELKWKEYGPVVKTLSIVSKADGCKSLTREITLIEGEPFVYIANTIDKLPILEKEGVHIGFSFGMEKPVLRSDIPWGVMELNKDQWRQGNKNWIASQRWVNISDSISNVTICSLNSPVFEVGDLSANMIGSAEGGHLWRLQTPNLPTVWYWVMNNHWHTNFQLSQEGKVTFKYILNPSNSTYDPSDANMFAVSQSRKLIPAFVNENYSCKAPFELNADKSVQISCIRPINQNKSMLVFLHSYSDKDQSATFVLQKGNKAYESNAYGTIIDKNSSTSFNVPAKGIKVVRIDR